MTPNIESGARGPDVPAADTAGSPPRRRDPDQGRSVLLVDDDASGRQALAQLISLWGMEVAAVADGSSALEQARARPPDIVLIDLELPDMNGVELARRLGALLGDGVLLYAFSGYGPDQRSAGLFAGHLEKPIDLDALRRLLGAEC